MWAGTVDADRARELRRAVLRPLDPPGTPLPGDDLTDAVHFAALGDDGTVLSTCFVYPDPWPFADPRHSRLTAPLNQPRHGWVAGGPNDAAGPDWHLRQMATDPGHRREGAGSAVLDAVVAFVSTHGDGLLWCHARQVAFGFYARHGFVEVGDLHASGRPPIAHKYMYRVHAV